MIRNARRFIESEAAGGVLLALAALAALVVSDEPSARPPEGGLARAWRDRPQAEGGTDESKPGR